MRSPRPGSLLSFAVAVLLCVMAGSSTYAQVFTQPKVVSTASWPHNFYAVDFDGDGNQDLLYLQPIVGAVAGQPDTLVEIVYGDGKGNFSAPVLQGQIAASGGIIATVADMNGDGIKDFIFVLGAVAPSQEDTYSVWYGNPQRATPVAATSKWLPSGNGKFSSIVVGQLDRSLGRSVFVFDGANDCEILALNGFGILQPYFDTSISGGTGPAVAYDLNGDGNVDLVVLSSTGHAVDVYLGTGYAPPFYNPVRYTGVSGASSMLLEDVNQDGRPDLILEGAKGRIDVFLGNGDGTFQTSSAGGTGTLDGTTGNGGHLITVADLNHDGQLDALAATPVGISALLGQGTQYFGLKGIYNAGPGHTSYATADFNGDGNLDIAVDSPEGIAILYGNPDGSFQTSQAFAAGQPAMSGALGVFTSSGNLDAVVSTGAMQAQFLHGDGDGSFLYAGMPNAAVPTTAQNGVSGLWSSVLPGDFNNDGNMDLALVANGASTLFPAGSVGSVVQLGDGQGNFAAPATVALHLPDSCAATDNPFYGRGMVADINGDGIPDLLVSGRAEDWVDLGATGAPDLTAFVLYTDGAPCPTAEQDFALAGNLGMPGPLPSNLVLQYQLPGPSNGHLLLQNQSQAADFSLDGNLTTPGQQIAPILADSLTAPSPTLGFPAAIGSGVIADLDRDGNNDLIVTYANLSANLQAPTASAPNYIYIWYGSGSGQFLTSAKHPVNPVRLTPSRNFYQVAIADMNGDGIPDLILSDGYIVSVQLGNGDGTFGAETHYLGGQGINTISVADVNHDGKLDLVLANGGAVLTNPVANLEVLATNPDVNTGGITVLLNQAAPALQMPTGSVIATPEPTTYGEAFGLTATITSTGAPSPTGTVAFSIDGNSVGSASLVGTTATISVVPQAAYSTLAVGTHTVTATYSGDSNYAQATLTGTHAVSLIPTTISLDLCVDPPGSNFPCGVNFPTVPPPLISPITMYFGQSIDGVAVESESDLTGQIIFYNGTSVFCTLNANLQQGGMMCPAASGFFPVGNTQVTVDYTGDATHAASMSNAVQVIVSPDPTTATVTSSANPSMLGQAVTFTANVQGNYAVATGAVTFLDGGAYIGAASLDATGHATFPTSSLTLGKHSITVSYAGNGSFNPSVSPVLAQVVAAAVTGTVVASPEPSLIGNSFTMTAIVTPPAASATTIPTGAIAFSIDGVLIGQAALVNGVAMLAGPATLAVGTHTMSAVYSGDTNYLTASFAGSHAVVLSPTTTTLVPDGATTIYYGQAANSSYVVTGSSATHQPTGSFTVQDNGVSVSYCTAIPLGSSCPYADGGANKLTLGTHALVVLYLGDSYNAPSASAPLVFTVIPDTTNATLTSSDNPALVGTSVTFTATIAGNYATPSGTVSFMDGATTLGTLPLNANGVATFSTSSLTVGTHPITVVFNSNPDFNPVTSSVLNELITDGPTTFTLTVTPTPVTIGVGLDAVLQVTVTATGGFAEPVQLSCSGLPVEAACTFNETLIPAGGGITTLYFSTKAPRNCGTNDPYFTGLGSHPIPTTTGIVLACLTMLPLYRRRRLLTRAILLSLVTLCGLAALSGCGHCTDLGTRPGNYTFTVTGTAQGSTPLTASQTVPVTVTIP